MKRICTFFVVCLFALTACGKATTDIPEETTYSPVTESVGTEKNEPETKETAIVEPVYSTIEALTEVEDILSVKIVDHSFPGIDIATLPEAAAEQYRVLAEDYTTWEIRYTVNSVEAIAYAAAPNTYADTTSSFILYARGGNGSYGAATPQGAVSNAYLLRSVVICPDYSEADEFGGSDVENVTFWMDVIPSLGFVNPDEVWLLGESRGGMEGCLTLLQDDEHIIKAAVLASGIYDLHALWESRTDMREMLTRRIGGTPSDFPEAYSERSAVTFADKIDTPLLLVHSTGDKNVPYTQAEDFAKTLAEHGKTYKLITRENDVHGLTAAEMPTILTWLRENGK